MKMKINFLDNEIKFIDGYINNIEVENKKYFFRIINNLLLINDEYNDEILFFDENFEEINFTNKLNIIIDYFNIDFNNKKYLTEVNKLFIEQLTEDNRKKINNEYKKIISLLKTNLNKIDIPITINDEIDIISLLKIFKLSINSKDEIIEKLLLLIDIEKIFHINKLLIFVNLKQYLSKEELKELYKYSIYNNIKILLIDSQCYGTCNEFEKKLIIDENLEEYML